MNRTTIGPGGIGLFACLVFICTMNAAPAATYYVDQANAAARDTNPGTSALPWRTIQKAANTVRAGDTCIVKSGTYNERITFPTASTGQPGSRITFKSEPRRTVTMQGFMTAHANYLRIEGFNITATQLGYERTPIWLTSDFVEIVDCYFSDCADAPISADYSKAVLPKNAYIANNRIYKCQFGLSIYGTDWLVENNEVERLYDWKNNTSDNDYVRFFGSSLTFRNNMFHGTTKADVNGAHVDGFQTFNNNGEVCSNIIIEGNVIENFHQGIILQNNINMPGIQDFTIRNNVFRANTDANWLDTPYAERWGSYGVLAESVTNVKVTHNLFINMNIYGVGFTQHNAASPGGSGIIENNIFYNNVGRGYYHDANSTYVAGKNLLYQSAAGSPPGAADLLNRDPLFVAPGLADFHVLLGSPAIDVGMNAGVTIDKDGRPRPQFAGYDIGPYEFGTGAVITPVPTPPPNLATLWESFE